MITCEFMGRTGNNMFQIAVTYAFAQKFNELAEFPYHENKQIDLLFNYFNLKKRSCEPTNIFIEPAGKNQIHHIAKSKKLCLAGFFQRHEYFDFIKEKLISDVFNVPLDWHPNTIGVHVRRTDFLNDPENFPVQPVSFYMKALENLNFKDKKVVFCSDDINWCKENFNFSNVSFRENTNIIEDIYYIANCDAVVMSNSTASFWMAYLNTNNRQIYFPLHWFSKKSGRNGYEICPKNWKGI